MQIVCLQTTRSKWKAATVRLPCGLLMLSQQLACAAHHNADALDSLPVQLRRTAHQADITHLGLQIAMLQLSWQGEDLAAPNQVHLKQR